MLEQPEGNTLRNRRSRRRNLGWSFDEFGNTARDVRDGVMVDRRGVLTQFLSPEDRRRLTERSVSRALAWLVPEYLAWIVLTAVAISPIPWPLRLGASILSGTMIGVIFTVGHDASHQALTPHRWLNHLIARLAFLPSAHAASLWDIGHNRIHHGFSNLMGADYVWEPMSPAQYAAAPAARRVFYRLYRSGFGHLPYYLIEMWWKKNFLPIAPETRGEWRRHLFDSAFVVITQGLLIWAIISSGAMLAPSHSHLETLAFGWLIPFLFWNWLIGLVIYMHHTHPDIGWFSSQDDWSIYRAGVMGCVEARMPGIIDRIDNNIMRHHAHHVHPAIPMYHLSAAQERLLEAFPETKRLTILPATVSACVRACKLFDPEARCWRDFDGKATSPSLPLPPPHQTAREAVHA
jgi:omega-6 fatty acid desaturase (delta-12 desaturase)